VHLHALDYVLWVAAPCLEAGVLFFMHRRGLAAQLPFFYGYITFQAVTDVSLLITERLSYVAYFYSYWAVTILSVAFTFAIIDELFRVAFRDFAAIRNLGTSIFRWAALMVLIAAVLTAFSFLNDNHLAGFSGLVVMADRSARAMLCLLALLLLLGARQLHISRHSILFGIATGFVLYMLAKVALDSIALMHLASSLMVTRINSLFYLSSCVLWLLYAMYGERLPEPLELRGATGPLLDRTNVIDAINRIVEESMRNARGTI
jgi:hypothetical protein